MTFWGGRREVNGEGSDFGLLFAFLPAVEQLTSSKSSMFSLYAVPAVGHRHLCQGLKSVMTTVQAAATKRDWSLETGGF